MTHTPATTPEQIPDDIREQRKAKRAFNVLNYLGIGWLINSSLSLYITYNVLPTEAAQKGIGHLRDGIYSAMSGIMKATNGGKLPAGNQLKYAHDKARSAAEILCMCISGTLLMAPMKWMEDAKQPIVNWFDRRMNAKYYREHPEALAYMDAHANDPKPESDEVGWGRILAARGAGVATNLAADQMIEAYNNHRSAQGLGNVDTAEWSIGNQVYDRLNPSTRERVINFFSRKGVTVESIQPGVRERIADVVGNDPKRMVFAEQARLFQKEFGLTLLLAGVVFAVSKGKLFGKHGEKENPAEHDIPVPATALLETLDEPEEHHKNVGKKWADKAPQPETYQHKLAHAPAAVMEATP